MSSQRQSKQKQNQKNIFSRKQRSQVFNTVRNITFPRHIYFFTCIYCTIFTKVNGCISYYVLQTHHYVSFSVYTVTHSPISHSIPPLVLHSKYPKISPNCLPRLFPLVISTFHSCFLCQTLWPHFAPTNQSILHLYRLLQILSLLHT